MSRVPTDKDFGPPPPGYVAGLGRGATGFTTRSDLGPARNQTTIVTTGQPPLPGTEDNDMKDYSDAVYDKWSGFNDRLFSTSAYGADDEAADRIWEYVDRRMDQRRKRRREEKEKELLQKHKKQRPNIKTQFADLKKSLAQVTVDEWKNIPEIGDYTIKKQKFEIYTPLPDTLLERAKIENEKYSSIDVQQSGSETPMDLRAMGEARNAMLRSNLQKLEDSVSGHSTVDPKSYLTSLSFQKALGETEITDIKKARELLKSVTTTNPTHGAGWIAAARVEEYAGRLSAARRIIMKGCEACPEQEDVWLEAARLQTPKNAKAVFAQAVKHIPNSVNIWIAAANLETDVKAKKRVLRRALQIIPNSVKLWKEAVELEEDEEDARIMLGRAVECIPDNVDLWLALARLETYENAKAVLNKARSKIPTEPRIWITAAELEETQNRINNVEAIIRKCIKSMNDHNVVIKREDWIKYAQKSEEGSHYETCRAIIRNTIGIGLEDADREHTWMDDAADSLKSGHIRTTRAIYAHALSVFPNNAELWILAAELEKKHGTREEVLELLKKACSCCPKNEELWLRAAKETWLGGDVDGARQILAQAFGVNKDSEEIWLAAVKLESANNEHERARKLLEKARTQAGTARVWMKSAMFERQYGDRKEELALLEKALESYPNDEKLWLMRAQWEEEHDKLQQAEEIYFKALKNCPNSIPLWIRAAELEEKLGHVTKARALLEKGRLKNLGNEILWLSSVRTEMRAGLPQMAQTLLAKALQECPNSGMLWAESIEMEPRPKRKARSVLALKQCDKDPYVITSVAKLFWEERKIAKARSWFIRAVTMDPDVGDSYVAWYKFELLHGTKEQQNEVIEKCKAAEPHSGLLWNRVRKYWKNADKSIEELIKICATQKIC